LQPRHTTSSRHGQGCRKPLRLSATLSVLCIMLTGCRQDMHNQPKFYPQRSTTFFADGRSARPQVPNTIARSQGPNNDYLHTGLIDGKEGDTLPFVLTPEVLARGQERYNVYCSPCHSRVGNGLGMIVQRGYYPAANFHSTRLRDAPLGHFVQVIADGYGAMPSYRAEILPQDRWAVAVYIRALQLSQNADQKDVPTGRRVENLHDLIASNGFADDFVTAWTNSKAAPPPLPAAAVPTPAPPATQQTPETPPSAKGLAEPASSSKVAAPDALGAKPDSAVIATKPLAAVVPPPAKTHVRDLDAGQETYMARCAGCHKINRVGMPPNIPSLIGIVEKVGAEHVHNVITTGIPTGKPPMPAFNTLTEDEIQDLIAYLKAAK
jgi:mono/diheme cytochrome c family protein